MREKMTLSVDRSGSWSIKQLYSKWLGKFVEKSISGIPSSSNQFYHMALSQHTLMGLCLEDLLRRCNWKVISLEGV